MASRKFTWTGPTGGVAKRTSKSRDYTHVVVVYPATVEARAAAYERFALDLEARADRLEAAAVAGRTRLRDRGLGGWSSKTPDENFHSHEVDLLGTEVAYKSRGARGTYCEANTRANHKGEAQTWRKYAMLDVVPVIRDGETDHSGEVMVIIPAAGYVVAQALQQAKDLRASAAVVRQEVIDQPEDPSKPGVVRWSSSRDLATKALPEFSYFVERFGQTLSVEEVDAR